MTVIVAGGAAQAQLSSEQQSALKSNCRSNFMANCSGVTPGSRDALMCLQKNVANLSPGCQAAVKSTMPAAAAPPPPKAAAPMPPAPAPAAAAAPAAAPPPPAASAAPAPATAMAPPPAAKPAKAATPHKKSNTAVATPSPAAAPAAQPIPMGRIENLSVRVRLQVMRACNADQDAVCPNVQRGGGRIVACLAAHQQALSPRCRETLAKALQ